MPRAIRVRKEQLMEVLGLIDETLDFSNTIPEFSGSDVRVTEPIAGEDDGVSIQCGPTTDDIIKMTVPDGFYGSRMTRIV